MLARQQRFQQIRQGRLQRQQLVDQRAVGVPQRFPALPERIEDAPGAQHQIVDPALHVVAAGRLRREFGKLAVAGERDMHLGHAPPGLRHVAQIGDLFLALAGMHARRQQALLLDEAVEIGRASRSRASPWLATKAWTTPIALFSLPSTSSTLPSSAGVLAKPATSVRKRPISISGLRPGSKLPIDLDDIVVVDQRGAAGLVGLDGADMLGLPDRLVAEAVGRPEFEPQALFALIDRQRLLQIAQQQRDEDLVGGDVEQGAFAGALPNGGQRMRVVALAVEAHPFDLHRQHVARR